MEPLAQTRNDWPGKPWLTDAPGAPLWCMSVCLPGEEEPPPISLDNAEPREQSLSGGMRLGLVRPTSSSHPGCSRILTVAQLAGPGCLSTYIPRPHPRAEMATCCLASSTGSCYRDLGVSSRYPNVSSCSHSLSLGLRARGLDYLECIKRRRTCLPSLSSIL